MLDPLRRKKGAKEVSTSVVIEQRIEILDVVRGFALLGILIMNLPGFSSSFFAEVDGSHLWPAWHDQWAETVRDMLFDGKFNSMFSLLFGLGFTIQLGRLMAKTPDTAVITYTRRLVFLFLIGLTHIVLLWNGDVLHIYALLGLMLLALRNASDRMVYAILAAAILFSPIHGMIRLLIAHFDGAAVSAELTANHIAAWKVWIDSNNLAFGTGTYMESVRERAAEQIFFHSSVRRALGVANVYTILLSTMLIGFIIGRKGWVSQISERMPTIRRLQWWTLSIGLLCAAVFGSAEMFYRTPGPSVIKLLANVAYIVSRLTLAMFYVLTIVRLAQSPVWQRRFAPLAVAGRMPLSNYLLQSVIASVIFQGWGLGFWGKVGPALELLLAPAIFFLIQIPLSVWWLNRYRFGPMEWVWRYATYRARPQWKLPVVGGAEARIASG